MKNVLILGTSAIGKSVAKCMQQQGHTVRVIGRSTDPKFELLDKTTWSGVDLTGVDELHFTIHDGQQGLNQAFAILDYLNRLAPRQMRVIVYSSLWGSITETNTLERTSSYKYKMIKAALNMGVKCLQMQPTTAAKFVLIHPGSFRSRLNALSPDVVDRCASQLVKFVDNWNGEFGFFNASNGETIQF